MYESSSVISGLKVAILEPVLLLSRSELILRSDTYTPSVHCSSSCTVGIQTWLILYHCSLRAGDKVVSQHCTVSHLWVVRLNVIIDNGITTEIIYSSLLSDPFQLKTLVVRAIQYKAGDNNACNGRHIR